MGHGLGMQVTEWPSHTDSDHTVIEENMVLTLEPGLVWAPGKAMVHEENLVVRAAGAELLSRRAALSCPSLSRDARLAHRVIKVIDQVSRLLKPHVKAHQTPGVVLSRPD